MVKNLERLKAQYWYFFVRKELILKEIVEIDKSLHAQGRMSVLSSRNAEFTKQSRRLENLRKLIDDPLLNNIYSYSDMAAQLNRLSNNIGAGYQFDTYLGKFKVGERPVPETLLDRIEKLVSGSKNANITGPYSLFQILETRTLSEAVWSIHSELLSVLQNKGVCDSPDLDRAVKMLDLQSNASIFSGVLTMLENLNKVINIMYPCNGWDKCTAYVCPSNTPTDELKLENLRQPKLLPIEVAAPIVISYAVVRARYFGEEHYLAKLCFEDEYLKVLNVKYMMNEELWYRGDDLSTSYMPDENSSTAKELEDLNALQTISTFQSAHYKTRLLSSGVAKAIKNYDS
ncbi:hypothetical protein [Marisediminitalea sp.]|uniref:hypothetical protein n=1 Tax=Marisediminitalea sp. TaxID=2662268 RepID=UPI003518F31B